MKRESDLKKVGPIGGLNFSIAKCFCLIFILLGARTACAQMQDSAKTPARHSRIAKYGIANLTDDQRKKIGALETPLSKETLPLINQLAEKRAHLKTLQTAEKTDLNSINMTIDEISQVQGQLMKKRAAHTQAIRKILTDDQRIAFDMRSNTFDEFRFQPHKRIRNFHRKVG